MMESLREWAGPVASVLAVAGIIYTWLTARSKGNSDKIEKHEEKLTEHDRRIQDVEGEMRHLPSKDDFQDLRVGITEVNGRLGRLEESNSGVHRAVHRMEEYLLHRENRS